MATKMYLDSTSEISIDEIKDSCECNDNDVPEEDTEAYYDIVTHLQTTDVDDFFGNLRYSKYNNKPCIIVGTLGLWDGRHDIYPTYQNSIEDAISNCIEHADDYKIYIDDDTLKVSVYHHDGSNHFSILVLSKKGENHYGNEDKPFDFDDKSNFLRVRQLW